PVIGTATSHGTPIALTRKRSTFGRDGLNLAALQDLTENRATSPKRFYDIANQFGFTFNWAYASHDTTAYFSSGLLPVRAPGLDRRPPTLRARAGAAPVAAHPGHRRVRVARLPAGEGPPARHDDARGPAPELEQPVGARV